MEGGGVVFNELGDENIIDPFTAEFDEIIVSIDPGFRNPTGCVWVGRLNESYYVIADYSVKQKSIEEHAKAIIEKCKDIGMQVDKSTGMYVALIDSASKSENLGSLRTVALQFCDNGLWVNTSVNKTVLEGIYHIKTLLKNSVGERRLFIFRSCVNLIREMRMMNWADDGRPFKKNDHCVDALRYALMGEKKSLNPRRPKTNIEEKKQRLIRSNYDFM